MPLSYLQKLVGSEHSHSNGVEGHQCEHIAFVAVGFVLVTLQLLLHQLLHLLHVLRGLRRARGVHTDGLTPHCTRAWTCCHEKKRIDGRVLSVIPHRTVEYVSKESKNSPV